MEAENEGELSFESHDRCGDCRSFFTPRAHFHVREERSKCLSARNTFRAKNIDLVETATDSSDMGIVRSTVT